ncbi:heat shock factor protein 5-like [Pithys albifrons albifrons]|uniref:heat shock factor protein 5-like n=1 Tax=Pithys albifrons albifrons TaxID=3385563 RepID=UPI003A5D1C30
MCVQLPAGALPRGAVAAEAVALQALRARGPACRDSPSATGAMEEVPLPAGVSPGTFPARLWQLVNSPRVRSVRWDPRAQGLLVDRALFERELLSAGGAVGAGGDVAVAAPGVFKATNFGSFVRQLNICSCAVPVCEGCSAREEATKGQLVKQGSCNPSVYSSV